jgi:hypothetical protein
MGKAEGKACDCLAPGAARIAIDYRGSGALERTASRSR